MTECVFPWHEALYRSVLARIAKLPHALLLHGPEGTGKFHLAMLLAQGLVCEQPADTGPCGSCTSCTWFSLSSHPDFRCIEPETGGDSGEETREARVENAQITVDQVRRLPDFLNLSTHRGGRRVILIHPAERLNVNAANALLKNLEEPPQNTFFLLVSHRPHHLLATIKSRCEVIASPGPTRETAAAWLESQGIADAELAAAHSGNAPLLAARWTAEEYWQPRREFLNQLGDGRFDPITAAERSQGYPVPQVLSWLQKWSYDLAAQKFVGRIRYNPDYGPALAALARRLEPLPVLRFHREMVRLQRFARHPLNARLLFESILFSYGNLLTGTPAA